MTFQTRMLDNQYSRLVIANPFPPEMITQALRSVQFSLTYGLTICKASALKSDGENIIFPVTASEVVTTKRSQVRLTFDPHQVASVTFINPHDQTTRLHRRLIDHSQAGMSFRNFSSSQAFLPQTVLPNLEISINNEPLGIFHGQVVYNRRLFSIQKQQFNQVGLKFLKP